MGFTVIVMLLIITLGFGCKGCNKDCPNLELVDLTLDIDFAPKDLIPGRICSVPIPEGDLASNLGQNPKLYFSGQGSLTPSKYVLTAKVITACENYASVVAPFYDEEEVDIFNDVGGDENYVRFSLNLKVGDATPTIKVPKNNDFTFEMQYFEPCTTGCFSPEINAGNPYRGKFSYKTVLTLEKDETKNILFLYTDSDTPVGGQSCD